jgi:hypothetical protein
MDAGMKEQIIEKAVRRALDNGWNPFRNVSFEINSYVTRIVFTAEGPSGNPADRVEGSIFGTIFDHSFAKVIWGKDWEKHIQAMVLAEDPIQYLGEHL